MTRKFAITALTIGLILLPSIAVAETVSTLTLDSFSFVSFGDNEEVYLPAGSTIVFRFGDANSDGSVPFTIDPQGVSFAPAALPQSAGSLQYTMPTSTTGIMRITAAGRQIDFNARIRATITGTNSNGSFEYYMPFTTEIATATDLPKTVQLSIEGLRLVEGTWYLQLVGATTNKEHAFPEPGAAVYTLLSGTFDQIP